MRLFIFSMNHLQLSYLNTGKFWGGLLFGHLIISINFCEDLTDVIFTLIDLIKFGLFCL